MTEKRVALVTGASKGIGRAIAQELAGDGIKVWINYQGSEAKAKETAEKIREAGGEAECVQCNVADAEQVDAMMQAILKTDGRLDILVNNAGITRDNLIMKMSDQEFDEVIHTNLKGCFHTIRAVSRPMLKQKAGRIINIASVSGILGNAGQANYSASKAGVIGLTRTVARELAGRGITVNAIAPGFVDTEMTQVLSERIKEEAVRQIPLGKFGRPEDIAYMAAYLASEKAAYITGQVISVDGGMAIG